MTRSSDNRLRSTAYGVAALVPGVVVALPWLRVLEPISPERSLLSLLVSGLAVLAGLAIIYESVVERRIARVFAALVALGLGVGAALQSSEIRWAWSLDDLNRLADSGGPECTAGRACRAGHFLIRGVDALEVGTILWMGPDRTCEAFGWLKPTTDADQAELQATIQDHEAWLIELSPAADGWYAVCGYS